MKFEENPYYSPEKCGLRILHQLDTGPAYNFDIFIVWEKLDDNTLWYDSDSGCSCPTPFSTRDNRHFLKPVTRENWHGFLEALDNHYRITKTEARRFRSLCTAHIRKHKIK